MATSDEIAAQMVATLSVSDPELDTSIGTTTRKIIDAVAESIAEGYVDQHMLTYQYDINSKVGADLDTFTQLFGISRLAAKRATGYVIFTRPTGDVSTPVFIPVNTQIQTSDQAPVVVITVTSATIQINQHSVVVPVQAAQGGPSGNVGAGGITTIVTPLQGVGSVTNIEALTGGTNQETDDALRDRWKKTIFRSLAGTGAMYLGIALDDPDCYAATVVGATSTHSEQIQVSAGSAISDIDPASVKFVYPRSSVVVATSVAQTTLTADYNTATDLTVTVASTAGFTATGNLSMAGFTASYTGISGNTFTGVTSTANTVIPSGTEVDQAIDNADVMLRDYDYVFSANVTVDPPVQSDPTTSASGGTLAAATYYYTITATTAYGETTASNEKSIATTGSTSSVGLSWVAVTNATGYKVYRGTSAGNENTLVTTIGSGSTVIYTDTGSAGLTGAPPAGNTAATSPTIAAAGPQSRLTDGQIYSLSYDYVSSASRNVPTSSINNRVDVWCAGTRAKNAQQSVIWTGGRLFNNGTGGNIGSPYAASLYIRPDGTVPKIGNVFIPLAFGPILTIPAELSIAGNTYSIATGVDGTDQLVGDYQIVHRDDCFGYTSKSLFGIEWNVTHVPASGSVFTVGDGYTINEIPANVQTLIDAWRLVGADARAHQAKQVFLRFNLAVMLTAGASPTGTYSAIGTSLSSFLQGLSFGGVLQVSDVLRVISNTVGVDNVRFLNGSDYPGTYNAGNPSATAVAIQQVVGGQIAHTFCDAVSGRPVDIVFPDNSVPVFDAIAGGGSVGMPSLRAQNTFGVG